jgi:hypothetical protein
MAFKMKGFSAFTKTYDHTTGEFSPSDKQLLNRAYDVVIERGGSKEEAMAAMEKKKKAIVKVDTQTFTNPEGEEIKKDSPAESYVPKWHETKDPITGEWRVKEE